MNRICQIRSTHNHVELVHVHIEHDGSVCEYSFFLPLAMSSLHTDSTPGSRLMFCRILRMFRSTDVHLVGAIKKSSQTARHTKHNSKQPNAWPFLLIETAILRWDSFFLPWFVLLFLSQHPYGSLSIRFMHFYPATHNHKNYRFKGNNHNQIR